MSEVEPGRILGVGADLGAGDSSQTPRLERAPEALVNGGRQQFGRFFNAPAQANLLDASYLGLPRALRNWRLKEWQAVQISTPDFFLNLALFNAKTMGLVQAKLYDKRSARKQLWEYQVLGGSIPIASAIHSSVNSYVRPPVLLHFDNRASAGYIHILLQMPAAYSSRGEVKRQAISARFSLNYRAGTPHVVSLPFERGGMYSHKGMFPVEGTLRIGRDTYELSESSCLAMLDDHKGYYPYIMRWDWLTSAWFEGAEPRAFNLTQNQCRDPERYNENCFWTGSSVGLLPAVRFEREAMGTARERWRVRDQEGRVDMEFQPTMPSETRVNAGLIESRYQGPFGILNGELKPYGMPVQTVQRRFGMGELFYLRC